MKCNWWNITDRWVFARDVLEKSSQSFFFKNFFLSLKQTPYKTVVLFSFFFLCPIATLRMVLSLHTSPCWLYRYPITFSPYSTCLQLKHTDFYHQRYPPSLSLSYSSLTWTQKWQTTVAHKKPI